MTEVIEVGTEASPSRAAARSAPWAPAWPGSGGRTTIGSKPALSSP